MDDEIFLDLVDYMEKEMDDAVTNRTIAESKGNRKDVVRFEERAKSFDEMIAQLCLIYSENKK